MVSPSPHPLIANRYRLERKIALGGMAEVWLAVDEHLPRQVAVKLLKPQLAGDAIAVERFRREAAMVASLQHPNIVTIHDMAEFDGRQAVVMEYVPGRSLREILDTKQKLSIEDTARLGIAVARALDAAHAAGLVHRDVKPGNILMTPDARVLLTDFGIAKATDGGDDLTSENIMMGTAKYLSPEQVKGHRLDGRADLYSLGLVLYECLSGRVPFRGSSDAETALARIQRDPTPLGRLRPTLPSELVSVIHRLLAIDPAKRPSSGAEVSAVLERVLRGEPAPRAPFPMTATGGDPLAGPFGQRTGTRTPSARTPSARTPSAGTPSGGMRKPATAPAPRRTSAVTAVSIIVAVLAAGGVAWMALRHRTTGASTAETPSGASGAYVVNGGSTHLVGRNLVTTLASFDPLGDKTENDSLLKFAKDGKTSTAWLTSCYQNQYFGAKQGVGIVVKLAGPATGRLALAFPNTPWNVEIYAADVPADSLAGWGKPLARDASQKATTATFTFDSSAQYLLLMLREVGRDAGCNKANPYRGGFSEISFGA